MGALAVEVLQIQFFDDAGGLCARLLFGSKVDTWSASAPGCFAMLLHLFCIMVFSDPEVDAAPSMLQLLPQRVTLGNWTLPSRVPRIWQFLFAVWVYSSWRNAWFNSGYMLRVSTWCFWKVFFVKENSNPDVDSRPALLGLRHAVWRSVHSLRSRLLELLHFEILTLFPRASRIWQPVAHCFSFASEEFFPDLTRCGGVARSPGVLTPK